MPNADYFADKAARCRELIGRTSNSYVADQLQLWADEFDLMASALSVRPIGQRHPSQRPSKAGRVS